MRFTGSEADVASPQGLLLTSGTLVVAGMLLNFAVTLFHPATEDPNDHAAVFAEYAADSGWKAVHLGQFAAALVVIAGLVVLYAALRTAGTATIWARLALAGAAATAAAIAILQGIDGIALKEAVDAWASAAPAEKAAAFRDAEIVRWTEWAANSYFRVLSGATIVLYGIAVARSQIVAAWLGAVAVIAGSLYIAVGVIVGYEGFSDAAAIVTAPADLLLLLLGAGIAAIAWRRGGPSAG